MKSNSFKEKINKFDFAGKLKICAIISAVLLLVGILVISIFGFNLGIDFTGGTVVNVKVGTVLEENNNYNTISSQITTIVEENGFKVGYVQQEGEGEEASVAVRFQDKKGLTEEKMQEEIELLIADLEDGIALNNQALDVEVSSGTRIAASSSKALIINSILAILVAVILMLIYIAIRFELLSGLTAILLLFHDVLVMCSLVAIFRIQINSGFIAALITIIGYSINNVIVVFDRIRDNKKKDSFKGMAAKDIANASIKNVFKRSLLTALTTMVSIVALTFIGVSSIREFLLPILFGLISGVYSSTMLAGPIWAFISDKTVSKKEKVRKGDNV